MVTGRSKRAPRSAELLVRDALAGCFVRAGAGDAEALRTLESLAGWSEGKAPEAALGTLRAENGCALFGADGSLVEPFASQEAYVRDRARRFGAALEWIGRDELFGDALECARIAWDAGLFFEVHEVLEPVWMREQGPRRQLLQGLIMAGAAMHHLVRGNLAGARGLLKQAALRLQAAEPEGNLDLVGFGRSLEELGERIERAEVQSPADLTVVPRLEGRPR